MSLLNIYTPAGQPLAYINALAPRSWVANKEGACKFAVSRNDAAALESSLRYGNLVRIEHAKLKPWVGVIDIDPDQRDWTLGEIRVTAYTAERLLRWGVTPINTNLKGASGEIFLELLNFYNDGADIKIEPGEITLDDETRVQKTGEDCYTLAYKMATRLGMEFEITSAVDTHGKLSLYGNWYKKRNYDTGLWLHSRVNLELKEPMLSEVGPIWNMVWGVSDAQTDGTRIEKGPYINQESINLYGKRRKKVIFSGTKTAAAVENMAKIFLNTNAHPRISTPVAVLDVGETWQALDIGANFRTYANAGFTAGRFGRTFMVRIAGMNYDEANQKVDINNEAL